MKMKPLLEVAEDIMNDINEAKEMNKPEIPKEVPSVIFWDQNRGCAFTHFKKCCKYLESKSIKSEVSLCSYDNSWSLEDMDHAIFEVEVQIKDI